MEQSGRDPAAGQPDPADADPATDDGVHIERPPLHEKRAAEDPAVSEDGRSARAREQRKERREQILQAATRVFAERGYHAASISDVIEAAGISRGTFYLYFDGKRTIFDELLDELFGHLEACVRPVDLSPASPNPFEQLRANVLRIMQYVARNQDLARILYRTGQGIDVGVDQKVSNFTEGVTELILRALRKGMQVGLVRPLDDRLVAHCIYGSVKELVFHLIESNRFDEKPLEDMVDQIIRYNIQGLVQT